MQALTNPEFLTALAALISAIAWPLLVVIALWLGRSRIAGVVDSLESLTLPGGWEAKFRRAVTKEIQQTVKPDSTAGRLPTEQQFKAAERIGKLALDADLSVIRDQLLNFAAEYERVRATMPAGDERTRRLEVVVAKIRTLAIAGSTLLGEFSGSSAPGERLVAVVLLQVKPDVDYIDWLAGRFALEPPFAAYHAAVALRTAVRVLPAADRDKLLAAIQKAKGLLGTGKDKTDRFQMLDSAEKELVEITHR
jgi:hypothetical protein